MVKIRWVIVTASLSIVLIVVSFVVGASIESPWDEAVANAQREPVITVPVEWREFRAEVLEAEGQYSAGNEVVIEAPELDGPCVVTRRLLDVGDEVTSGMVLTEVSGRPVIGLSTPFRLYRDLHLWDSGPDVKALQDAMGELGVYSGRSHGNYDDATARGVAAMYRNGGYIAGQEATELPGLRIDEIARLPEGRAEVLSVSAVGAEPGAVEASEAGSGLLRLRFGRASATVRVAVSSADAFAVGANLTVHSMADRNQAVPATVRELSEFKQGEEGEIPGYDALLVFNQGEAPGLADGAPVVASPVAEGRSIGEGLAVPLVALREGPSGTNVVVDGEGAAAVRVKDSGDGYALVESDDLEVGDDVVVSGLPGGGTSS